MTLIKNKIPINTQILTLFFGIFLIVTVSFILISVNYERISDQKDKINEVENIKFELYELNFKITQNEISKIELISSIRNIENHFEKLINKDSPLYDESITDSTQNQHLFIQLSDNEKRFFDAYKNWRFFAYLIDESLIQFHPNRSKENELSRENPVLLENLTSIRQIISKTLSDIRTNYLAEYSTIKKKYIIYFLIVTVVDLLYIGYMFFYTKKLILLPINKLLLKSTQINNYDSHSSSPKNAFSELLTIENTVDALVDITDDATKHISQIAANAKTPDNVIFSRYRNVPLFNAIKNMQDSLDRLAIEEQERKWSIEGQAIISDILNRYNHDFEQLSKQIIQGLVKYTSSLQGALFVIDKNQKGTSQHLEMVSSYAFDRFNKIDKQIEIGEGILGQVWRENKGVYMENIPEDHMRIKSFTGSARPKSILIETLVDNNEFYGVIELASLKTFSLFEREFIKKIAESIAATLATVENNNRTRNLLKESQQITAALQKQEEEALYNLAKLTETQEEIKRREIQKENELKAFTEQFNEEINAKNEELRIRETEIEHLKSTISAVSTDNKAIRSLKNEIGEIKKNHEHKVKDLNETIKIKELRVQKYKRKLERL